jgi:hypothetical protein
MEIIMCPPFLLLLPLLIMMWMVCLLLMLMHFHLLLFQLELGMMNSSLWISMLSMRRQQMMSDVPRGNVNH